MRASVRRTAIAAFVSIASGASTSAQASFERRNLTVPGNVLWITTGDLNGDGLVDLVVSFRRSAGPASKRYLGVFIRRKKGLPLRPDLHAAAPAGAAAFDLGDADGDGDDDLVYLMASGAFYQTLGGGPVRVEVGPLRRLASTPTLVVVPEEEDLVAWDFLRRLEPDGPPTLVLPGRRRLRMYRRVEGKQRWKSWCDVHLRQWSYYDAESGHYRPSGRGGSSGRPYAFRVTTIVPNIDFADQTGDGRLDLMTHYEDRVAVHPAGKDGCFAEEPSHRQWFKVRTPAELESRDQRVSGQVQDLDADGVADFIVSKIGGGITSLQTQLWLFRGRAGGGFVPEAAQTFRDGGFASLVRFIDVDGDGRLEMVHPHTEVSIMSMTRAMLSSSIGIDVRIRALGGAEGFFRPDPVQTLDVSIGLDLSSGAALRGSAPLFGHDFDADGKMDVVVPNGGDEMVMHRGRARRDGSGWFEDDGRVSLQAPGSNATLVLPVAEGSTPEILVYYPYRKDLSGRLVVFRSRDKKDQGR